MDVLTRETVVRLWDEHSAALVLYAQQFCGAPEDVVQEAFLLLVRQGSALENPVGWIYRVVRNRALNAARSHGRKSHREAVVAAQRKPWFETTVGDGLDAAEAAAALEELPLEQRETIVARLWGGLSFEEISQLSGTSLSAAYRSYQRGLATLREKLGTPCPTQKMKTKT